MDSLMQLGLATNLLAQIPQATLSATKLYSKHPYPACGLFAAVLLVLLAYKVLGGGASAGPRGSGARRSSGAAAVE